MKLTSIYNAIKNKKALTLIELIITIVLISIFILPTAKLFQQAIETLNYCNNSAMANNLLRMEMSVINNLAYSDLTLSDEYNRTTSNYQGYGFNLNRQVNIVSGTNNALKMVLVRIMKPGSFSAVSFEPLSASLAAKKPQPVFSGILAQAATYVGQNIIFGPASGGCTPSSAGQSGSLVVSGGDIYNNKLRNVTLANTDTQDITITGAIVTFSGQHGIKFSSLSMDGRTRWNGNENSPVTVDFTDDHYRDFTLSGSTTYNNTATFDFSKNLTSISVIFAMSDGTQTSEYTW